MKVNSSKIRVLLVLLFFSMFFVFINFASAAELSNKSIEAKAMLDQAQQDIQVMQNAGVSLTRVNETYQDALQIYNAQLALEQSGRSADYKFVISAATSISSIKESALKASDELKVFRETYLETKEKYNLSGMQSAYDEIEKSFTEERFEDTLTLIDKGYEEISEIQSSQTALALYYETTSRTLKKFFKDNWLKIAIILLVIGMLLILFWATIKKLRIKYRVRRLTLQKKVLNDMIKKLQYEYYETKKLSEIEFKVKLEHFKEMIIDIDREIPLLREEFAKIDKTALRESRKWQ